MSRFKFLSIVALVATLLIGCSRVVTKTHDVPKDPNFVFAWGISDWQQSEMNAVERAKIMARNELAQAQEARLMSLTKDFRRELGQGTDAELLSVFEQAIRQVVSTILYEASVRKTETSEKKKGGISLYKATVLMEQPKASANQALINRLKEEKRLRTLFESSKAYEELNQEVEKFEQYKKEQSGY